MSFRSAALISAVCALLLTAAGEAQLFRGEQKQGFVSLFSGRDLSGWAVMGEKSWTAENGLLACSGEGGGWLRSEKEYENFIWRLEYRISPGGNSGIFIRSTEQGNPAFTGMEIQVLDDYGKQPDTHTACAIYDAVAPTRNMSKPAGQWNRVEITCQGRNVVVIMNGEKIVNANLDRNPKLKDRVPKGYLGLQNHGSRVEYRRLRIKVLP